MKFMWKRERHIGIQIKILKISYFVCNFLVCRAEHSYLKYMFMYF